MGLEIASSDGNKAPLGGRLGFAIQARSQAAFRNGKIMMDREQEGLTNGKTLFHRP